MDLMTDPSNCSMCGMSCMNGGCNAGVCAPPPVQLLAAAGGDLLGVAVDANRVYFASLAAGTGSALSVNKSGMAPLTHWTGNGFVWWLAVNGNTLLFTMPGAGNVMRYDLSGTSAATPLASGQASPQRAVIDATRACWVNVGTTATNGSIVCATLGDGQVTTFATAQSRPGGVAIDNQFVYWTSRTSGTILRLPFTSPGTAPSVIALGQVAPIAIAVDAQNVYWANGSGTIMQAPAAGGGTPVPLVSAQTGLFDIVLDGANLYYSATFGAMNAGVIRRIPTAGGAFFTLAARQNYPGALVVDATDVYWRTPNVGILRTAK